MAIKAARVAAKQSAAAGNISSSKDRTETNNSNAHQALVAPVDKNKIPVGTSVLNTVLATAAVASVMALVAAGLASQGSDALSMFQ